MPSKSLKIVLKLVICLALGFTEIVAQDKSIDSLQTLIKTDKADTNKVRHLNELAQIYSNGYHQQYDTALSITNSVLELAQQLKFNKAIAGSYNQLGYINYLKSNHNEAIINYLKAQKIYNELGNQKGSLDIYYKLGNTYSDQGNSPKALENLFYALKLSKQINDTIITASIHKNIAGVYESQDNYTEALTHTLKALKLHEYLKDKKGQASLYNNLGTIYSVQKNYAEALKSYNASILLRKEINDTKGLATSYNNIGLIYQYQGNATEALKNYFQAIEFGKTNNYNVVAEASNNIGTIYIQQKNYVEALKFISTSLSMYEKRNYKYGIANSLINLSQVHIQLNNLKLAKEYLNKCLSYSKEIGSKYNIAEAYNSLSTIDSIQGNWKAAYEHNKLFIQYRDSLNNEESDKKITEIMLTNRFEKEAEKVKAENEKQRAIATEKNRRQTIISWSIGGGLFLVVLFAGFILRSLRITNKQKSIIEAQKDEVSIQKDIAEELRLISEKQKHIVEEKQKEILDSITYAKRIQTALLTSDDYIINNFEAEHFVLFKPKDIVSGDFYWAQSIPFIPGWDLGTNKVKLPPDEKRKNLFYITAADCTGHGVPGAFMSMLNISFLNENLIERGILLPHDILNSQRNEIIQALNPLGSKEESKDGMDCVLCVYDFNKMLMHFATANNPLWLVRNNELIEYKADKMPVGKYHEEMKSFTLQTIELQKGDVIYTSTDGFADQFGVNGKKMMKKKFKEELLKIHQQPLNEQKLYLETFFESWKGNSEQVDDVCVIGVRI
jgi:tetratricopeptide (TPR) repeat protein